MVKEQPTKKVLKELRAAGFAPERTSGSHTWWSHPSGVGVSVPDGHRTITPGVYRKIVAAIAKSKEQS
ncbi:MAG: type II toxin-antitoxin system HicA family toxin [Micrococcales bacterium]|nr:type II toxin-antitoxin system HicA family toxin [Micrococcales bacterium]